MFNIIAYFTIFCILIYIIWQGLIVVSSYLLLIDEKFVSALKDKDDILTNNLLETETNDTNIQKLNRHLRFDFLITITIGIIWFIFPKLLFYFTPIELSKMSSENKYLGQFLAILVILTSIISVKTIKKKKSLDKKLVLITKLICGIIVLIIQFIYIHYLRRINNYSIITLAFISVWMSNSIIGITKQ